MEPQLPATVVYAGFWRRALAAVIDGVIFTPLILITGVGAAVAIPIVTKHRNDLAVGFLVAGYFFVIAVAIIGGWLYYTLMESSKHRSTLGKMAAGIAVTDLNGNRISFARANGRYFGKWISGMTFYIGFIMAGFTEKKQALHDIIAGCLVVRK